ncbi:16S rRNA (guanine(527)-N(7))-methyltransferase RsmG [Yoonia sp. GPGPB17]|uniref:16S rRNA (guanine(527)-N(7))-methyltransferase RsmG n=1 Tax=Yoonia sp. GPGPB17 TaxID=3026147 RepID=UPI0030EC15ED
MAELAVFGDLVAKWTPKINLIARGSVASVWERHILDSAQLYRFAPKDYEKWVDIGSGGGFPGIVMAILAKSFHPQAQFILIESDQRKAAFLRTAARECGVRVTVLAQRIENAPEQAADVVSARALTALSGLLPVAQRHLKPGGSPYFTRVDRRDKKSPTAKRTGRLTLKVMPVLLILTPKYLRSEG